MGGVVDLLFWIMIFDILIGRNTPSIGGTFAQIWHENMVFCNYMCFMPMHPYTDIRFLHIIQSFLVQFFIV